jgi:hypothetical protein
MSHEISEADWRVISRELKPLALDRYCRRVLAEVSAVIASERSSHERYLELCHVIDRRDRELGNTFNDLRRSTATMQLLAMWSLGLFERSELDRLTAETRQWLLSCRKNET